MSTEDFISNNPGNVLIKYMDKWRGAYYLTTDLKFTTDRSLAIRFYILKAGNHIILNGDRVTINNSNQMIVVDPNNEVKMVDREQIFEGINTFFISSGHENTEPITYESPIYLLSDKTQNMALKYDWDTNTTEYYPRLINTPIYNENINTFQFFLERADTSITNTNSLTASPFQTIKKNFNLSDSHKSAILVILLMIVLILCVTASKF